MPLEIMISSLKLLEKYAGVLESSLENVAFIARATGWNVTYK
jgi:hypothetical protein